MQNGALVRTNAFFDGRRARARPVARCPGCDAPARGRPFMLVKGAPGTEGDGVAMPAVRCRVCALVFLNPRLPEADVAAFYKQSARLSGYFTSGFKAAVVCDRGFLPFVAQLERHLGSEQRDLLDLGCGAGAFMRLMAGRGFRVAGAEISPSVAEIARRELAVPVLAADADTAIDELARAQRKFDVVTMIHTFEHLPHPLRTLEKIGAILRPNGVVAVNVPNVRYFMVPLDRWLGTGLAGIWDPVGHFSYFSPRSLAATCERAGFAVESVRSRLLVYGRSGLLRALDAAGSALCQVFGGIGSNLAVIARATPAAAEPRPG